MKCIVFFSVMFVGLCYADLPTEIPDLDDLEVVKERCDKKGGVGTYDKIKKAQQETQTCIKGLINVDTIKQEVEEAKKTGSMDEVFGKYCGKRPQIIECIKKIHNAIQPCLEDNEKQALNVTANILTQISDFACFKDGDRIAMFVAEGGVECLQSRVEKIKDCVNQTLKFNPATFSPNSIPNLTVDKKKCNDLTSIQACIVKDLEDNCSDSTPANIIDAVFRFVKKTACKDVKPKRSIILKRRIRSNLAVTQAQIISEVEKKLKAICMKNSGEDTFKKLMATYSDTKLCLENYKMLVTPYSEYQKILINCTADSRRAMEDCLSEEEKFYPDFMFELLQAGVGFMYRNAEKILEIKTSNNVSTNCMMTVSQEVMKCCREYANSKNYTQPKIQPKSELCLDIKHYNECFSNAAANNACLKDKTQYVEDFVTSIEAPCQNKTAAKEA